jgi:excisionase family DNA binding protein
MDNLLLTPEQAAELLHIGRTTLYGLLRDGALRAVHIGRLCRVPHAELVRYVETLAAGMTAGARASGDAGGPTP